MPCAVCRGVGGGCGSTHVDCDGDGVAELDDGDGDEGPDRMVAKGPLWRRATVVLLWRGEAWPLRPRLGRAVRWGACGGGGDDFCMTSALLWAPICIAPPPPKGCLPTAVHRRRKGGAPPPSPSNV